MWARSATGTYVYTSTGGNITPTLTGYSVGDLLLVGTAEGPGTDTIADPAGWTRLSPNNRARQLVLFGKLAASTADTLPTVQWSSSTSNHAWIIAMAYSGAPATLTGIVDASGDNESTNTQNIGGVFGTVTPAQSNDLVIRIGVKNKTSASNGTTFTPPANFTSIAQQAPNSLAACGVWEEWIQTTATAVPSSASVGSLADATAQAFESVVVCLIGGAANSPSALLSWPKQTFVTETLIQV